MAKRRQSAGTEKRPTADKPAKRKRGRSRATSSPPVPPPGGEGAASNGDPAACRPGNCRAGYGRIAAEIPRENPTYFYDPWILSGELSLVVGVPNAGKSTFGAALCARAKRPAILPGHEEAVGASLMRRLAAAGVDLWSCLILDDRHWQMPGDCDDLADVLKAHRCDLLWIDPIDSYCAVENENDGNTVRPALEGFCRLAHDVACAVVGARHPGKSLANLCPGSRQWFAVPRQMIEMRYMEGPPQRRWMRLRKDPHGHGLACHAYAIVGGEGQVGAFQLGESLPVDVTQTWGTSDEIDEWKITDCMELLKGRLAEGPMEAQALYQLAAKEGFTDRMVRMAAKRLGMHSTRSGRGTEHKSTYPAYSGTPDRERHTPPPARIKTEEGGVSLSRTGVPEQTEPNAQSNPRAETSVPNEDNSHATAD